jgi:hypothetical protein
MQRICSIVKKKLEVLVLTLSLGKG